MTALRFSPDEADFPPASADSTLRPDSLANSLRCAKDAETEFFHPEAHASRGHFMDLPADTGPQPPLSLDIQWETALRDAIDGSETALRQLIHEQPHLRIGGAMDKAQARRLGLWAQLLARHAALGAIPQAAFVAADFFREAISSKDAERAVSERRARALSTEETGAADTPPMLSTPWDLLAFLGRKSPQSLESALKLAERADAAAGLENPYLRVLAWDHLARLLALDILVGRDRSAGALHAMAIALRRDISSPAGVVADVLHPLLQGEIPSFRDDLAMGSAALGLLEKRLGRAIRFADPRWAAFRDGRVFDEKAPDAAARVPALASFSALGDVSFARGKNSTPTALTSQTAADAPLATGSQPSPIKPPASSNPTASDRAAGREQAISSEPWR